MITRPHMDRLTNKCIRMNLRPSNRVYALKNGFKDHPRDMNVLIDAHYVWHRPSAEANSSEACWLSDVTEPVVFLE